MQAGPWAFSWLTLRSAEFYSTLSEFHCDVHRFVREFSHYNRRKLCAWNTKTNRDFVKKEWSGNQPGCPYLLLLLAANVVFCSCNNNTILFGRALCISFVIRSNYVLSKVQTTGNNSRCHTWCRCTYCAVAANKRKLLDQVYTHAVHLQIIACEVGLTA